MFVKENSDRKKNFFIYNGQLLHMETSSIESKGKAIVYDKKFICTMIKYLYSIGLEFHLIS